MDEPVFAVKLRKTGTRVRWWADGQVFNFRDWDAQHHVTGVGT